jgi:hypothetical protein
MIKSPIRLLTAIALAGATVLLNIPAFAQSPVVFTPGTALVYSAQHGMMQMNVNQGSHAAMMKRAKKLPANTVIFMDNGSIYMATGELDPGGNFTGRY